MKEHTYKRIPGMFNYELIYKAMVKRFPSGSTFLEIGSFCGRSGCYMATEIYNSGKDIKWNMVDSWGWNGHFDITYTDATNQKIDLKLTKQQAKNYAEKAVSQFTDFTTIHHGQSEKASKLFEDKAFDFIWVDGDHTEKGCRLDVEAWLPKMKPHGIIAGHDYLFSSQEGYVADAVNDIFGETSYIDYEYIKTLIDLPGWITEDVYKTWRDRKNSSKKLPHAIVYGDAWLVDLALHKF